MAGMFRRRGTAGTADGPGTVVGPVRIDHRTKRLVTRLRPGDIAVIDHEDLDRIAAESLVAAQPGAVLNVSSSSTGRYPNDGPLLLLRAGIPLVDDLGPAVMERLAEDDVVTVAGGDVLLGQDQVASGHAPGRGRRCWPSTR